MTRGHCGLPTLSRSLGEIALLDHCKAGDSDAWDTLIDRYEASVYKFAYSLCHNYEEANDITGQVLLRLYQNLHTYRNEASFSTWLLTIVRNTYLDMFVRTARIKPLSLDSCVTNGVERSVGDCLPDPAPSPEALYIEKERKQILARAIHHLPAYQRQVLRMYHAEGKSYEEIAETTGLRVGTIKSRLHRARTLLRERLTPYRESLTGI